MTTSMNPSSFTSSNRTPLSRPIRCAQRLPGERILFESLERFAEVEELHALAVSLLRVVDELDPLLRRAPAVRMEDGGEDALLRDHASSAAFQSSSIVGDFGPAC